MTQAKVVTVRIPHDEALRADIVARTEGISVNEVFRQALSHYFESKRGDAEFVARAKAMVAREAKIVGGLR